MRADTGSSGGAGGPVLMSQRDRARLTALAQQRKRPQAADGYAIGPDDLLEVRIPDLLEPEAGAALRPGTEGVVPAVAAAPAFRDGIRVSGSGDVTLPLVGQLRAAGLTPHALEREIARRLVSQGILRAPQVSVSVAEYRSGVVAVVGSVERPGLYPLTRPGATIGDMV